MGLAQRLRIAKLQLVVDARAEQGDLEQVVSAALRGGVDVVQLRDRKASSDELLAAFEVVKRLVAAVPTATAAINRDPAVARRSGADVLHLGAADGPMASARAALHEFGLVGRSVHHKEDFGHIDADYLFVGPVFSDAPGTPGLPIVTQAAHLLPVTDVTATPWFAIGGITRENLDQVLQAGALRVAVSDAILDADDPEAAAAELRSALQAAWDARPEMERYTIAALGGGSAKLIGSLP